MKTRLVLRPGQKGTRKLLNRYGSRLLFVRYRYDEKKRKRYKTAELIVDEVDWLPGGPDTHHEDIVHIKLFWAEFELRNKVKKTGGTRNIVHGSCLTARSLHSA